MKKLLVLFSMILCMSSLSFASEVHMRHRQLGSTHGGSTKSPVLPWIIDLDDYVLTMSATPCDYTLNLYDEDDESVLRPTPIIITVTSICKAILSRLERLIVAAPRLLAKQLFTD